MLLKGEVATAVWKRAHPSKRARILLLSKAEQDEYDTNRKLGFLDHLKILYPDEKEPWKSPSSKILERMTAVATRQAETVENVERKGQKSAYLSLKAGKVRAFGFEAPRRLYDHAVELPQSYFHPQGDFEWVYGKLNVESLKFVEIRFIASDSVAQIVARALAETEPAAAPPEPAHFVLPVSFKPEKARQRGRPSKRTDIEAATWQVIEDGSFSLQDLVKPQIFKIRDKMMLNNADLGINEKKLSDQTIERVVRRIRKEIASKSQ